MLSPGTRFGAYEIQAAIGAGGMGEVYRAHDTILGRVVALKVLPEVFAGDPERLARFEREAKTLATLNHPHIAQIYGVAETPSTPGHAGLRALAMEFVEGQDLAETIATLRRTGGPAPAIPIDEALAIARQVADALEAAHEQGIVHRDLKPANIKVTPDGSVKVLDFGLAKALDSASRVEGQGLSPGQPGPANSPTITSPAGMTAAGMILGTAAYMSPEQAHGRVADKRSDVWAFGCVLYEMLSGTRAFPGDDVMDTLAAVVRGEPDLSALPAATPPAIRTLIEQCLLKDRRARVSDIAAARYVLQHAAGPSASIASAPAPLALARRSRERWYAVAAAILLATTAGLTTREIRRALTPPPQLQVARLSVAPTSTHALRLGGVDRDLAITPDGSRIVYITRSNQIAVRRIDELDATILAGTSGARAPFVSPDGRWVGFVTGGELSKMEITGGPVTALLSGVTQPRGMVWGPDDRIIVATAGLGLRRVSAEGGDAEVLTKLAPSEQGHMWPSMLPDGRTVVFTILAGSTDQAKIALFNLDTREQTIVFSGGTQAEFVEPGYLIFAAGGGLRAVPFNRERREVTGTAVTVAEQVVTTSSGAINAAISRNGTLVYVPGTAVLGLTRKLAWVDRTGHVTPTASPPRSYVQPRLSPDGTRVVVDSRDQDQDVWVWDDRRETLTHLTFDPGVDQYPVWLPDGRHVVFGSARGGAPAIYRQAADGTGGGERLLEGEGGQGDPMSVSPDGRVVVRSRGAFALLTLDGTRKTDVLLRPATGLLQTGDVSPDGRWLAYDSTESGRLEVYVRPFPRVNEGRWQVSTSGGARPAWARSGLELFYLDAGGQMTVVPVRTRDVFSSGVPQRLFDTEPFLGLIASVRTWDVSQDGRRFLMIQDRPTEIAGASPALVVVLNWIEELKAKVPMPAR